MQVNSVENSNEIVSLSPSNRLTVDRTVAIDAAGPRFVVPCAPEAGKGPNRLRKAIQRLLAYNKSHVGDSERPLIPPSLVKRDNAPQSPVMRTITTVLKSPKTAMKGLLGRPERDTVAVSLHSDYVLGSEELMEGMISAPPSPLSCSSIEDRIAANYKECLKQHSIVPPLSVPEMCSLLARVRTEQMQLDDNGRLYLIPLDDRLATGCFLSRSYPTRVGRNNGRLFKAKSRVVSRNHCQIFAESNRHFDKLAFYVIDVGSHSGTFVNGMRLSPTGTISSPCVLQNGDILQLGTTFHPRPSPTEAGSVDEEESDLHLNSVVFLAVYGVPLVKRIRQIATPTGQCTLLSAGKIARLHKKIVSAFSAEHSAGLYVEFGDLLHENSSGIALFVRRDGPCYAIRFNNYRLCWEATIGEVSAAAGVSSYLFAECTASRADQFVVFARREAEGECGRRIARVNGKDPEHFVVTPISEHRPLQATKPSTEPAVCMITASPASPYVTIPKALPASPLRSAASLHSPRSAPQFILNPAAMISRPEIPFYCLSSLPNGSFKIVGCDHNNADKERLLGEGVVNGGGLLRWGKQVARWQGDLAVCKDDMLIVLGLFLQIITQKLS